MEIGISNLGVATFDDIKIGPGIPLPPELTSSS